MTVSWFMINSGVKNRKKTSFLITNYRQNFLSCDNFTSFRYHRSVLEVKKRSQLMTFRDTRATKSSCRRSGSLSLAMTVRFRVAARYREREKGKKRNWVIPPVFLLFQLGINLIMVGSRGNNKFTLLLLLKYHIKAEIVGIGDFRASTPWHWDFSLNSTLKSIKCVIPTTATWLDGDLNQTSYRGLLDGTMGRARSEREWRKGRNGQTTSEFHLAGNEFCSRVSHCQTGKLRLHLGLSLLD